MEDLAKEVIKDKIEVIQKKEKKPKQTNSSEYNKKYYLEHKDHILNDLHAPIVTCKTCGTTVTRNHLPRHQKGSLCKRRSERNKLSAELENKKKGV